MGHRIKLKLTSVQSKLGMAWGLLAGRGVTVGQLYIIIVQYEIAAPRHLGRPKNANKLSLYRIVLTSTAADWKLSFTPFSP